MKADMKRALYDAFEAPAPVRKETFLRTVPGAQIGHMKFMITQIGYIKKWTWAVSALAFMIALNGASAIGKDMLWILSSIMPFIALAFTTENAKSAAYGMDELETASRFSLRSVMLARMGILGFFHMILAGVFVIVCRSNSTYTFWQTGVYLTVPYLLTTTLGLAAVRRIRGKESLYVCMGIAAFVSVLHIVLAGGIGLLYQERYFPGWVMVFIMLFVLLIAECYKTINQMEEPIWNLQ